MSFDLKTFGGALADGTGVFGAGAAGFGLPACALQLAELALALIPAQILRAIDDALAEWEEKIDQVIKDAFNWLATKFGIKQFLTEDGLIALQIEGLNSLDFWIPAAIAKMLEAGANIWQQIEGLETLYETIKKCLAQIKDALEGPDNEQLQEAARNSFDNDPEVSRYLAYVDEARQQKETIVNKRNEIGNELRLRRLDPNREPALRPEFAGLFEGIPFKVADPVEDEEVIRLVFGPPQTTEGQLLLSIDGLYYDSQSDEGLVPVLNALADRASRIDPADRWKFDYDSNIGGKGDQVSSRSFNKWIDSIFDLNLVDNSEMMEEHYDRDGFLRTLIGQRDKRVSDIETQISTIAPESQAIINNFKQSIISEASRYEAKINRRKKQIEIAVKAPSLFLGCEVFAPGKVPINDFSYLQKFNLNIALSNQEKLIINTEDVSGVVMPLEPRFVKASPKNNAQVIDHLFIPNEGFDAIVTDELDTEDTSSAATINLDEMVTTEGLIGLYNFLNSDVVLPSSIEYNLNNCASNDDVNDGQLVAKYSKDFFSSLGLAAPFFEGITVNSGNNPSALGCFAKLPDSNDLQNWTYNKEGFSFDTWVNVPGLKLGHTWFSERGFGWKDNDSSGLYRLILANENTGIAHNAIREEDYNEVPYSDGSDYVRGMIFGFTIDQRWTGKKLPSNDFEAQHPDVSGYGLLLAPTISYDASSVAFITKLPCDSSQGWRGMFISHVKETASGKRLEHCERDFMHLAFSVDYNKDLITVYLDGEVLETSSVSEVFGTNPYNSVRIPSFKKDNSFEYSEATVGPLAPKSLKNGPKTYPFFTPWIIGGGYTDGYATGGNFMGGIYGGQRSGLRGHLGSVKLYNKSITESSVKNNYNVQKRLFKNIDADRSRSVFIFLGQSNMDGSYTVQTNPRYIGPMEWSRIWTPNSVGSTQGKWLISDMLNFPQRLDPASPTFGYGNLHATRYNIFEADLDPTRFGFSPLKFGMEAPFTDLVSQYEGGNEIYVIKNARGTTSMVSGFNDIEKPLSWTDKSSFAYNIQGSGLYTTLVNDVDAAMTKLREEQPDKNFEIRAIIMIQGEFDAYPHDGQTNFPDPWQIGHLWGHYFSGTLYADLQQDVKNIIGQPTRPDIPWIIGRIHSEMERPDNPALSAELRGDIPSNVSAVRAQQEAVANRVDLNVYLVDQDGLTHVFQGGQTSNVHFDSPSLEVLGHRFFEKYKYIIQGRYE